MIQDKVRYQQFIDYSNLMFGTIHPTDSDGEIEYHDKAWIFFEIKHGNKDIPFGQRLALERKIDDITRSGKKAVLFVAEHFISNPGIDIDAAACKVRSFYYKNKWYNGDGNDLKTYVVRFIDMVDSVFT